MKLRASVVITTNELETILYQYVGGRLHSWQGLDNYVELAPANTVELEPDDVSAQLRFDDDVEGAIVDIYTADPITSHDDKEGTG